MKALPRLVFLAATIIGVAFLAFGDQSVGWEERAAMAIDEKRPGLLRSRLARRSFLRRASAFGAVGAGLAAAAPVFLLRL